MADLNSREAAVGVAVRSRVRAELLCGQKPLTLACFLLQGREGEIRHLFRGFAFLHCKKLVENGGMFVCKTRHLVLAGGSKVSTSCSLLLCCA